MRDFWVEGTRGLNSVNLYGCTSIRVGTREAEAAARAALARAGLSDVRLSNRIVIEP